MYLYFGAVDEDAWIYLNGELAYEHTCASTGLTPNQIYGRPFAFDARAYLKRGQLNTLAVRVHNSAGMGGIWRPVYVVASDRELNGALIEAALEQASQY